MKGAVEALLISWLPDGIHIFLPKIPLWEYSGGPLNGKWVYIL
jgi:hypothetical protein